MTEPRQLIVKKQRSVHTYSELWHASDCVLQSGLGNPAGSTWQYLSSIVLTAFTFEAYINHVGERTLQSWPSLEKSPVFTKFSLLIELLKVDGLGEKSTRPLQTVHKLMTFRNTIAHGRSVDLSTEEIVEYHPDRDLFANSPVTDWESLIHDGGKFALRVRADVEEVLKKIHEKRTDEKEDLFSLGTGHHSAVLHSQQTIG